MDRSYSVGEKSMDGNGIWSVLRRALHIEP